jgi:hypothetical protein
MEAALIAQIFIEPHERIEALEAYRGWLTADQERQISDAPEGALIGLKRDMMARTTVVTVVEEG